MFWIRKPGIWILISACSLVLAGPFAYARYEYRFDKSVSPFGQVESESASKLSRGITNAGYGWTELIQTPIRMSEGPRNHVAKGILLGVPYGLFRTIGRTVVGAYEVATFYVPQSPIFRPIQGEIV